jgi:hypothetical protein
VGLLPLRRGLRELQQLLQWVEALRAVQLPLAGNGSAVSWLHLALSWKQHPASRSSLAGASSLLWLARMPQCEKKQRRPASALLLQQLLLLLQAVQMGRQLLLLLFRQLRGQAKGRRLQTAHTEHVQLQSSRARGCLQVVAAAAGWCHRLS